jgi:hypothetical protein
MERVTIGIHAAERSIDTPRGQSHPQTSKAVVQRRANLLGALFAPTQVAQFEREIERALADPQLQTAAPPLRLDIAPPDLDSSPSAELTHIERKLLLQPLDALDRNEAKKTQHVTAPTTPMTESDVATIARKRGVLVPLEFQQRSPGTLTVIVPTRKHQIDWVRLQSLLHPSVRLVKCSKTKHYSIVNREKTLCATDFPGGCAPDSNACAASGRLVFTAPVGVFSEKTLRKSTA